MHYLITVLSKEGQDIDEQLAPFQENNMGDCPKEYLEFVSHTEIEKERYENESTDKVRLADGTLVNSWNNCLYRAITEEEYKKQDGSDVCHSIIDGKHFYGIKDLESIGATYVEVPFKELYPTFEEYMEDYTGISFDEEKQDYGYWENPNSKWDWYSVGGRWSDMLVAKDGVKGDKGEPSLICSYTNTASNKYSSLKIKDIDWEHDEMKEFVTYGILTPDGIWHDKDDTPSSKKWYKSLNANIPREESRELLKQADEEWDKEYKELMSKADPEWTITLVDIHR